MKADYLFTNGKIYTGVRPNPAQYLAVREGRIIATGRGSGKSHSGRNTEIIDLKGLSVTPGLVDAHLHFLDYAFNLSRVQLDHCKSRNEVIETLKERASRVVPGEWIQGRGWTTDHFGGFPHRKILDDIFPQNPVVLNSHDEHFRWLNTKALEACSLKAPLTVEGGFVGTDADGSLNGLLGENAVALIRPFLPKPDAETRRNAILSAQNKLHSLGITGFHSTDANQAFGDLQGLNAEGRLRLRVFHSIPIRQLQQAVELSLKSGLGDEWFRLGFVKIFSDGALGPRTAWMLKPYEESDDMGIETISEQELTEKVGLALENGIAVGVHAIGDRANRQCLNAFEKNAHLLSVPRARSRIEHAQLLHPDDIPRFRKIGVVPSMQPYHAISDESFAARFWGKRAKYSYAWHSLANAGAMLLFGSDAPVEDPNPLLGLEAAVNRSNWDDRSQSISARDALRAYTLNAAIASGEESDRGTLEPGKRADLTVFSDDPVATKFQGIRVVGTAVAGEFVYRDF